MSRSLPVVLSFPLLFVSPQPPIRNRPPRLDPAIPAYFFNALTAKFV